MGDNLLAELEHCGVDTEYTFRADAASPRTLILLDDTGERTIIAVDSEAGSSSFLPIRSPDLRSADCVYIEGYTRYPTDIATARQPEQRGRQFEGKNQRPLTMPFGGRAIFRGVRKVGCKKMGWLRRYPH